MSWHYQVEHNSGFTTHPLENFLQATPQELLDIQPTFLLIEEPITKEEWEYLRQFDRLVHLKVQPPSLFNGSLKGMFNNILHLKSTIFDQVFEEEAACFARLKRLEVFDLFDGLKGSSTLGLGRSLKHFTQLTQLDMMCFLVDILPTLIPYISDLTALQHIWLRNYSLNWPWSILGSNDLQKLVSHLSVLTQLVSLYFEHLVDGGNEGCVKELCSLISSLPHLTALRLPNNGFNPRSIAKLCGTISQLSGLTDLDLSFSTLDKGGMNALGKMVANSSILHLELRDITWKMGGFETFVAQFDHWSRLLSLNLSHGDRGDTISRENTIELAGQLSKLTSLNLLNIRCCHQDDYLPLLEPLKSLPLKALFLRAPKESVTRLENTFPSKYVVEGSSYYLIQDPSLPTLNSFENFKSLFPTNVRSAHLPMTPLYWTQFESFKPIYQTQPETYLMQPMLYHHLRYPEQVYLLWIQHHYHVSFLESVLLNQPLIPPDMNTALKYHRWSEIVGYNPGLIHYGDYILQHLTVDNLISTFISYHALKKNVLPQRDASGEQEESTGEEDELVSWDGLLSYLVSKWNDWSSDKTTKKQILDSCGGQIPNILYIKAIDDLNVEWRMKENLSDDRKRRQDLFHTTTHFLHLSPTIRPDMTVVIHDGVNVMHLHSHVVMNRWGMSTHLNGHVRRLETQKVIYHLELDEEVAELVGYLMEYCYTGEVDKFRLLTPIQVHMIGKMKETTIYSVAALIPGQQAVLDPVLMDWRQQQLHPTKPSQPIQPIQPRQPIQQSNPPIQQSNPPTKPTPNDGEGCEIS